MVSGREKTIEHCTKIPREALSVVDISASDFGFEMEL